MDFIFYVNLYELDTNKPDLIQLSQACSFIKGYLKFLFSLNA